MKKIILLILLAAGLSVGAQNTLSLSGGDGRPGETVTVSLSLLNSDAVTALQTFIPLGSNLTYVPGSAALSGRSNGHQLSATVLHDTLRIYSYSLDLNAYTGDSGEWLTFSVVLGQEPGMTIIAPTGTVLSSTTGSSLAVSNAAGAINVLAPKIRVTPTAVDYGHVPIRSSYTRNVTLTNIGNEPLTLNGVTFSDATLSGDVPATLAVGVQQSVTVSYAPVTAGATTMTAIFHSNAKVGDSVLTLTADPFSVNELRPLNCTGYTDNDVIVELRINNMDSIVGMQTSFKLPTALTYVDNSLEIESTRSQGHVATAGMRGDTLTLIVTSIQNKPFRGPDGVVARFTLHLHGYGSHTLRPLQTILSDVSGTNVLSAVYNGTVSIYSPSLSIGSSLDFGSSSVTETDSADLPLLNNGNAQLVIDHVAFTHDGWHLLNTLPLTVDNYGRDTLHVTFDGSAEGNNSAEMLLYTNDPRNDLKRINLTAQRYEPNTLYMVGNPRASASAPEIEIVLENYSAVTALQMDVKYPYTQFTMEPSDISLTSRASGHTVNAARLNDSTIRLLVLSMSNTPFTGNDGAVARMRLHANRSVEGDRHLVSLSNVMGACTDGVDRMSAIQTTYWLTSPEPTSGHTVTITVVPLGDENITVLGDNIANPSAGVFTTTVDDHGSKTIMAYANGNPNYTFAMWQNAATYMPVAMTEECTLTDVTADLNLMLVYNVTPSQDVDYLTYEDATTKIVVTGVNEDYRGVVTNLVIPATVETTGNYLFDGCPALTTVVYQGATTAMGTNTFYGCTALQSVTLPESMTALPEGTFYGCTSLPTVTLPESIESVGAYAFKDCDGIYSLTMPNAVQTIGTMAFANMSGLRFVTLGSGTRSIASRAFSGVSNLVHTNFAGTLEDWMAINFEGALSNPMAQSRNLAINGQVITRLEVPAGITEVKAYTFFFDTLITDITLPNTVTNIADSAFYRLTNLNTITLGNVLPTVAADAFERVVKANVTVVVPCALYADAVSTAWGGFTNFRAESIPTLTLVQTPGGNVEVMEGHELSCANPTTTMIRAIAAPNYRFVTWSDGIAANPRTLDMTGIDQLTLSAIWERNTNANTTSVRHITFEDGTVDQASFYSYSEGANNWVIGTAAANTQGTWGGTKGMYVSNNAGVSNDYSDDAELTYTYAELKLNSGFYEIAFDYNVAGNASDNLTVALFNDSADPDGLTLADGQILHAALYNTDTWRTKSRLVNIPTEGWYRLAFFWNTSENTDVDNPGAAIDNIFVNYQSEIGDRFAHVAVNVNDPNMGRAIAYIDPQTGAEYTQHDYYYGQTIEISAVANDNYRFIGWSDGVMADTRQLRFEDLWGQNMTYTANFEAVPTSYTVTVVAENGTEDKAIYGVVAADNYVGNETVEHSKTIAIDNNATLYVALPLGRWAFIGWLDGTTGDTLRANPYVVEARNADVTFTAILKEYQGCDNADTDEYDSNGNPVFVNVNTSISVENGQIVIDGAETMEVTLYDAVGRKVDSLIADGQRLYFDVPAGIYIVEIGNLPARKVVVVR